VAEDLPRVDLLRRAARTLCVGGEVRHRVIAHHD